MKSLKAGLQFHGRAIKAGLTLAVVTSNKLITLYSKHGLIQEAQKLFDEMPERNVFTWNAIISGHVGCQNLARARTLFESAPEKDGVTYNTLLSGFVKAEGYETNAINLFQDMRCSKSERVKVDEFTLIRMLNLTAKLLVPSYGRQLHSVVVKTGNDADGFAVSALIDMYSKCGCYQEAYGVFNGNPSVVVDRVLKNAMIASFCRGDEMEMAKSLFLKQPELNNAVSWNTLISGYAHRDYNEAVNSFRRMSEEGFKWNEHTFSILLSACSSLRNLKHSKEIHCWILKHKMSYNLFVSSSIVDVYCKCGDLKYAKSVNASVGTKSLFAVTSMIVWYASEGDMVEARSLFDSLSAKNSVLWATLFSGYVKSQNCEAVFELLREYQAEATTVLDTQILVSVLSACSMQAAIDPGKQVHGRFLRTVVEMDEKLITATVDMYSKCGNIAYAMNVFERATIRDSILYNVMISGHAHHGNESKATQLFDEMVELGFIPDKVTFLALLSACRHSGSVETGEKYFHSMVEDYGITPGNDHCACLVDLYGRSNQLEKAVAFIRRIPVEIDAVILGTLLNACRMNKNVELAKEVEEELLRVDGENGSRYVQLANVYAAERNWDEMGKMRKRMRGKEVKKVAGCSWVYVDNKVQAFASDDRSHSQAEAVYLILAGIYCRTRQDNSALLTFL